MGYHIQCFRQHKYFPQATIAGQAGHIGRKYQLYVGNLTWWTTDADIAECVQNAGVHDFLEVKFYENRANGQSKGFCCVSVASEPSMRVIIEKLPKQELHGQVPVVTYATKQALHQFEAQSKTRPPTANSGGATNGMRSGSVGPTAAHAQPPPGVPPAGGVPQSTIPGGPPPHIVRGGPPPRGPPPSIRGPPPSAGYVYKVHFYSHLNTVISICVYQNVTNQMPNSFTLMYMITFQVLCCKFSLTIILYQFMPCNSIGCKCIWKHIFCNFYFMLVPSKSKQNTVHSKFNQSCHDVFSVLTCDFIVLIIPFCCVKDIMKTHHVQKWNGFVFILEIFQASHKIEK